jgi:hypothetical protein
MATSPTSDSPPAPLPADAIALRPYPAEPRDGQPTPHPHHRPAGELSPESLLQRYLDLSG